jgi:hypothetical protein
LVCGLEKDLNSAAIPFPQELSIATNFTLQLYPEPTVTMASNYTTESTFLNIPSEVRDHICLYTLSPSGEVCLSATDEDSPQILTEYQIDSNLCIPIELNLLTTCKQLNTECKNLLWTYNTLWISPANLWLTELGKFPVRKLHFLLNATLERSLVATEQMFTWMNGLAKNGTLKSVSVQIPYTDRSLEEVDELLRLLPDDSLRDVLDKSSGLCARKMRCARDYNYLLWDALDNTTLTKVDNKLILETPFSFELHPLLSKNVYQKEFSQLGLTWNYLYALYDVFSEVWWDRKLLIKDRKELQNGLWVDREKWCTKYDNSEDNLERDNSEGGAPADAVSIHQDLGEGLEEGGSEDEDLEDEDSKDEDLECQDSEWEGEEEDLEEGSMEGEGPEEGENLEGVWWKRRTLESMMPLKFLLRILPILYFQ